MRRGVTGVLLVTAAAVGPGCRNCSSVPTLAPGASPLEGAIARELGRQLGASITVACVMMPPRCTAALPDHTTLPLALHSSGGEWTWRVDGLLVRAEPLEAQIHAALVDLDADRAVACGPRVRRIAPDEVVECTLAGGGRAFATVRLDGTVALELELDPAAAAARAEPPTADHDRALAATSSALASAGDVDDDGEGGGDGGGDGGEGGFAPSDGGVPDGRPPQ